jgi:hypothetical protein
MLFDDAPEGPMPSPTQTYFEIAFLDASDAVLGTPVRLDLPKNRETDVLPDDWRMHSLMGTAPAGTTKVRVTAAATDMVASCTFNCPGGQDVYLDNFTLRDSILPNSERLTNGNLDLAGAPAGWTLQKTPQDNVQFSTADYARHNGNVGMWLRAFSGGDVTLAQTVPGTPGGDYTFSAFSKWELGYSGGDPLFDTQTLMKLEFLDAAAAVVGTQMLDLRTVQMSDGEWRDFSVNGTAPAGTANVRVSVSATGMMNSGINPQSAMFDDFSLMLASAAVPGDYNNNGIVDAADYVVWRNGGPLANEVTTPGNVTPEDYDAWRARFGNISGTASGNLLATATSVPEPAGFAWAVISLLGSFASRPRRLSMT